MIKQRFKNQPCYPLRRGARMQNPSHMQRGHGRSHAETGGGGKASSLSLCSTATAVMVRQLARYLKMAALITRCTTGLSAGSSKAMGYRTISSFISGPSNPTAWVTPHRAIDYRRRDDDRPNLPRMTATAALFSSTSRRQIARPDGAVKLASIDFNPGASDALTPVVIMHGLLGNSRNFQGWGAKLVKSLDQERRVFAVDMRNHGSSSHHESMSYVDMADDILGFLAEKGLSEAVLVGHSMGGKVAAMTALLHPQAVKGLVIMDIAPVSYSMVDATNWGDTQRIIEAIHKMPLEGVNSRRDADQLLSKDILDPALRAFAVTNLDKDPATGGWAWRINIDAIQRSMGMLAQFDSGKRHREAIEGRLVARAGDAEEDELGSYGGDTLFVAGGNSRYVRSQHLKEIGRLFPKFVVSTIKGAGHWVHADNPQETLRMTKSFLDRPELG